MLFPTFVVLTTVVAFVPEGPTLVGEIRSEFQQLLPVDTISLLQSSIQARHIASSQLILSATSLSVFAGLGLMLTLMDGFRRAYRLPREEWGFWHRRLRALLLVPIVLVPLSLATLLLVFGHAIELWIIVNAGHQLRSIVLVLWRIARWSVALATSVSVLGALYHFGTKRGEHWTHVMPGAIAATVVWFPATLTFRMVRYADRRLLDVLRVIWCRRRDPHLALHHVFQRTHGCGIERRPFQRTSKSSLDGDSEENLFRL